jgi:hypothetical protein
MNSKSWLKIFFILILIQVLAIELFYRTYSYSRHDVDYLVKTELPQLKGKSYDTVIIGDSLAHNSIGQLKLHPNILDLTSNNSVSLAGNYFILKRYLKQNHPPKDIYLFCIPNHLHQNLDTIFTYSYFTTIFTNDEEKKSIQKIKPHIYDDYSFSKYTESRLKALKIFTHYKPKKKKDAPPKILASELHYKKNFMNSQIREKIDQVKHDENRIYEVPKTYIDKILELCKTNNIHFHLVIEPVPKESNESFKRSKIYRYLQDKNVSVYNVSDHYQFKNYFFRGDGVHLRGKTNQFYQNYIDEHILDIY